jgi:hypothetical protein
MQAIGTSIQSALLRTQPAFRFRTHLLNFIKLFLRGALLSKRELILEEIGLCRSSNNSPTSLVRIELPAISASVKWN